jgi:hypothetical protein
MKLRQRTAPALILLSLGFLFFCVTGAMSSVQAQTVQVTAADPMSTTQGTVNLNVKITGKGFKNGAKSEVVRDRNDRHGRRDGQLHYLREFRRTDRQHYCG